MREYADDPATAATAAEWAALVDPTEVVLPTDGSGANVVAAADSVTVAVSAATTATLLTRAPATFGARLDELLLAALARTLGAWCGRATVCIDAEGHGRDPLRPEVDITRTVGWFTAIAPARLTVTTDDIAGAVAGIVEQLRGRPGPAPRSAPCATSRRPPRCGTSSAPSHRASSASTTWAGSGGHRGRPARDQGGPGAGRTDARPRAARAGT